MEEAVEMSNSINQNRLLELTADFICSQVASNAVPISDLPLIIDNVYDGLSQAGAHAAAAAAEPAVPIKQSVKKDHIVCLEDGKKFKMLKRHLRTAFDMTPDEYRAKWGLPASYPMVAPNYAAVRSDLAKKIGLGHSSRKGRASAAKKK